MTSTRLRCAASLLLLASGALAAQDAYRPGDAKVATYYFYWYRWPDEHFGDHGIPDHTHHFKAPREVSYLDPAWHKAQFKSMAQCGIDFALPVYWGAPGAYQRGPIRFSRDGLPAMLQALRELDREDAPAVRLGMMYDTTTLLCDVRGVPPRGGKANLRTPAGRDLFCQTIVEYFEQIPKRHWARIDGRPLVVLYSSAFASAWHRRLGADARAAFGRRFAGEGLFLVAEQSWGDIGQDRTTGWGAALHGPIVKPGVVAIGPGYDDSAAPGRTTPIRDRDGGRFYQWSWRHAITARPQLVLLETWNELHEGTGICETVETGRLYLDLTRAYTARLRQGDPGPEVVRRVQTLRYRPEPGWGIEGRGADTVFADYTLQAPRRSGLREVALGDGPIRVSRGRLHPYRAPPSGTHVYFKIADPFCFDADTTLQVAVDLDAAAARRGIALEYDARGLDDNPEGEPYRRAVGVLSRPASGVQRLTFTLEHARCANRQNGNADFRLAVREARTMIRRVQVSRRR